MHHLMINHVDHPHRSAGGIPPSVTAGIVAHGQVRLLDMRPDRDTPMPGGRRWTKADGAPIEVLMDCHLAAEAVERDPGRYLKGHKP
jgi:hypothetical protein